MNSFSPPSSPSVSVMTRSSEPIGDAGRYLLYKGTNMVWAWLNVRTKNNEDDAFLDNLDGGSDVLRAVRRNEIKRLKKFVARSPDALETTGHMGRRPLHIAVENANAEMVTFLIDAGADENGTRERNDTPLFWAPNAKIAEILIKAGADLHATDFSGREPIHWAAQFGRPDVIALLLDHGCDVNIGDDNGHTPLHWATGACGFIHICDMTDPKSLDCVELLIERGADVNARGTDGNVPLHGVAVMPEMDQRLIDGTLKFPPEIPDTIISIVRLLLQRGADPSVTNNDGVSPLSMSDDRMRAEMGAFSKKSK